MTDTRKWSALAAVLAVAIFAAGWFLLIAPKHSEAAALQQQAATRADANARLTEKIKVLQAQQADLPQKQAELATLRTQIPNNPALPSLIRDLTAAGNKVGVTIDSMAPAPPVAMVSAPSVAVAATSTAGETGSAGSTAAAAGTAKAESLYQVPLSLNVTGSYFELEQFINKLEKLDRALLVKGFTLGEAKSEEAAAGDLTITLDGRVFLNQPAVATTTTTPVAATATSGE